MVRGVGLRMGCCLRCWGLLGGVRFMLVMSLSDFGGVDGDGGWRMEVGRREKGKGEVLLERFRVVSDNDVLYPYKCYFGISLLFISHEHKSCHGQ